MEVLVDGSVSTHTRHVHASNTRSFSRQEEDCDIALANQLDAEEPIVKRDNEVQKKIEKMKRANRGLFRADVKPVILDDFQDLLLTDKLEEIKASKGRLKIKKMLHDADQVSDILSMVITKLIQGAPGDSGSKALKKNADAFAIKIAPTISQIRQNPEFKTYRQVAAELTRQGYKPDRGEENDAEWQHTSVRNIEMRIEKLKKAGKIKPV